MLAAGGAGDTMKSSIRGAHPTPLYNRPGYFSMSVTPSPPPLTCRASAWAVYLTAFAGGMAMCFYPTFSSGFQRMQAGIGDPVFNHYVLEHSWRWLSDTDYPASFWSPRFFYPTPKTLTYSENMVGVAPLYWGLRSAASPENAFQWWMILIVAANYASMLVALRWFGVNPVLATFGAFLFAFGLPRQNQFGHHQLLPHAFAPLAVWYMWAFTRAPDRRRWVLLLVLTAWQVLASIHLGWFLFLGLGVWLVVAILFDRSTWRRVWDFVIAQRWFVALTVVVWVAGLGTFFQHYYRGNQTLHRSFDECLFYMPRPASWLACPPHTPWELRLAPGEAADDCERRLGMGLGVLIIVAVGSAWTFVARRRGMNEATFLLPAMMLTTALILFAVTLRLDERITLWYPFFYGIPGADSIRAVGRVVFTVMLFGLTGGLISFQAFLEACVVSPRLRTLIASFALLACAGEQVCTGVESFDRREFYPAATALAGEFRDADAVLVLNEYNSGTPDYLQELTAMWAGLQANVPVINGYSGRWPDGYTYPSRQAPADAPAAAARFLGEAWHGRLLVVEPGEPPRRNIYFIRGGRVLGREGQ